MLCALILWLRERNRALTYMETHAGRGLYDLEAPEAVKTGEAAAGWLQAMKTPERVPGALLKIVKDLNGGTNAPLYPGSPLVAGRLLRGHDRLHLMELHPQEYAALEKTFAGDERATLYKTDGYEGVLSLCPPTPRKGLVLIDPSYEIKDEYLQAAGFIDRLRRRWAEATIALWYPLLPAGRHVAMLDALRETQGADAVYHEYAWAQAGEGTGMYGSGMALVNFAGTLPGFLQL